MTSFAINPSVITPLSAAADPLAVESGSPPAPTPTPTPVAAPMTNPMVLNPQTLPSISNPVVLPSIENMAPAAPALGMPVAPGIEPVAQPLQPAAPKITLPDIAQMEAQLQTSGALVSDIPDQPAVDTSPLAHLQPNVVEPPGEIALANTSLSAPLAPIKLASTAPATIPATAAAYQPPTGEGLGSLMMKVSLGVVTTISIAALGWMMYQRNPNILGLGTNSTGSPTFEVQSTAEDSKAEWYQ